MVYNPRPEVAAVRDAAKTLGDELGTEVDRAVVVFTTTSGYLGAVSYGTDIERCGVARRLADALYEAAVRQLEEIEDKHHRHVLGRYNPDGPDFDGYAADVVDRLELMEKVLKSLPDGDLKRMMVRDLITPACELLARFCACVDIEESQDEEGGA